MKKILITTISLSVFLFGSSCPNLGDENLTAVERALANSTLYRLKKTMPTIEKVYIDLIKKYNGNDEYYKYVNADDLKKLAETKIFGELTSASYSENKLKYELIIDNINPAKENWCDDYIYTKKIKFQNNENN